MPSQFLAGWNAEIVYARARRCRSRTITQRRRPGWDYAATAPTTAPTSKSPASTPSSSHTPSSGHHVLTLADNGKTVSLAVGQSVSVRLGGPWLWREPVVDGGAIDVAQVNFFVDPGYSEWAVRGLRAGRATLQINGEANCPTEGDTVCILGAKVFAVTFAVG